MEDEERAQRDAHFQEELEYLKTSVARLTSLLEQTLRNTSGEGPSNRPVTFNQTPITAQPEERMSEHGQEPQHNPAFVQSATPAPAPTVMDAFANESHQAKSSDSLDQEKIATLEARIKVIEGVDLYDSVRAAEMCLVPNVVVPKKFRVPEFIKYSGTQCPMTHLKSYCNKMAEVIRRWKDLVDAFIKQYKYNMDIAPDRTSLSNLEKRDKESIRDYAQRWRESAAQVHPPLLDKEMVTLFANTLKAPYYEHVMGSSAQQFTDAVLVCERIEQGVKSGRISAPTEKRGFERKDVNHIGDDYKGRKTSYQNYHTPSQVADIKKPEPQNFQAKSQIGNYQRVQEQLPPLPLPLNEMYQKLLSIGHVAPEPLAPLQPPYPGWYKPELTCEYHAGVSGHSIHTCNAFKRKLLQLIKAGWIELEDTSNVNTNLLPNHA
ncbi:uncharacterized protein LOC112323885 [Populus trichocarpa]|uniref:uncharacterized protein LOC112323885 n=1 Tax=Populus trichocarpa TaxID=3694 RepID=UPI000D18A918|nr:uncharacterized protein LOC112323885 [Populus trichocarpa]|eukprot:XP_024439614.1 uncharacterized protein LOC112323885 [Populus trichocarpa]